MRVSEFIRANHQSIVKEWEVFARSLLPNCALTSTDLRDHAEEILDAIVEDMSSFQTDDERAEKSKGRGAQRCLRGAGYIHAVLRLQRGFTLAQLVAEYRALRASVLRLYGQSDGASDLDGVTRFNEAIDEALTAATSRYMEMVDRYRDQFIGILGHDLRNPIGAISMGASTLARSPGLDAATIRVIARIQSSARRMDRMVCDLLDLTRARLTAGIPIRRAPTDLAPICRQVVAELKEVHPHEPLRFAWKGDLHGQWDADRLAQVVSNLVGNALQHGTKETPVTLIARGDSNEVVLEVHNEGPPIPPAVTGTLFEPMVHHQPEPAGAATSLGLGLFIAEQVVTAHGGKIGFTSTADEGTTFTVHLPRIAS